MKRMALLLVAVIVLPQMYPETPKKKSAVQKFFNIFAPTPTPTPRKKLKIDKQQRQESKQSPILITPTPTPKEKRSPTGAFIVDTQWIANYREQELAWSYPIPEDDQIKFEAGQYHVPPIVYRHFEDMLKTIRPDR